MLIRLTLAHRYPPGPLPVWAKRGNIFTTASAPSRSEEGAYVEVLISWQVSDLGTLVERRLAETLEPFGVTPGEYRVLLVLMERGPMTASEVAPHVTLEQSLVSRTVQRLYEKGLVSRRRSRTDRRNVTLRATEAGAELAGKLEQPLQELDEELTRGIPGGRLAQATRVIEAMTRNAQPPR